MANRRTKDQREADGKTHLRQRLMDIASGANQGCSLDGPEGDPGGFYYAMGPENFFGFVRAVMGEFPVTEGVAKVVYEVWNLEKLATIDDAIEHLWYCGIRP